VNLHETGYEFYTVCGHVSPTILKSLLMVNGERNKEVRVANATY